MRISLFVRTIAIATVTSFGLVAMPAIATAADDPQAVQTWNQVPAKVTKAQTVWALTKTAGLSLHSTTEIESVVCAEGPGFLVTALYGEKATKEINVTEQRVDASCRDEIETWAGLVKKITIPGAKISISAQCGFDPKTNQPVASWVASGGTGGCKASDVKKSGGLIQLTQTKKTKAKAQSMLWIETSGLTYAQLVKIANGLKPLY